MEGSVALAIVRTDAAVGVIGDGPVNLMYLGVLAVGCAGAVVARFHPRGMALALLATAIAQMLVPAIALVIWRVGWQELLVDPSSPNPPFDPGVAPVFGLNAVFAALWLISASLFREAALKRPAAVANKAIPAQIKDIRAGLRRSLISRALSGCDSQRASQRRRPVASKRSPGRARVRRP